MFKGASKNLIFQFRYFFCQNFVRIYFLKFYGLIFYFVQNIDIPSYKSNPLVG